MTQPNGSGNKTELDFDNKLKKLSIEKLEKIIAESIKNELGENFLCTILKMELGESFMGDSFINLKLKRYN